MELVQYIYENVLKCSRLMIDIVLQFGTQFYQCLIVQDGFPDSLIQGLV